LKDLIIDPNSALGVFDSCKESDVIKARV